MIQTITYDDTLYQLVPKEPTPEHIESMALRFDHGHGIKQSFPPETDDQFKMRQELNRRVARQMYEEATGKGFFKIAAPTPPAQPEQSLRIEISDEEFKRLTELPPGFHNCSFSNEPVNTVVVIAGESAQGPAQPAEQQSIPAGLWNAILDAGLALHKEGDKWWVEKAVQPAERNHLNEEKSDLYWRLHILSKALESSGRIDEHDMPDAYATILDAMAAACPAQPVESAQSADDELSKIEAEYWLKSRAAIIDAIESAGFALMSTSSGFWLQKKP